MSINESSKIQNSKFLRAKKLAEHLNVGLSTIWLWNKQGKISSHKISEKITVFNVDEVERALFGGEK